MATNFGGYTGKVLEIDLSQRKISEYPWTDTDREKYLGGKIMAMQVLRDCLSDNPVIISTGPLTGAGAPASRRYEITAISPKNNRTASTNCGGRFGLMLKRAGYDAVIIRGKSASPLWIEIDGDKVCFHDAHELWGMKATPCRNRIRELTGKDDASCLCIGPAGEKQLVYAAAVGEERAMGRSGIGAVLGEKKLKAISVCGDRDIPMKDSVAAKKLLKEWFEHLYMHPVTGGGQSGGCAGCPINCGRTEKSFKLPGLKLTEDESKRIARELDEVGVDAGAAADSLAGLKSLGEVMETINSLNLPEMPDKEKTGEHHRRDSGCNALIDHFGIEDEESFRKLYKALGEAASASGLCLFTVNGLVFEGSAPKLHHADMLAAVTGMEMDMEKFLGIGEDFVK